MSTAQAILNQGGFFDASETGLDVERADYVIIGSGAGGGAAARVLSQVGSVVVLEQGPLARMDQLSPILNDSLNHLFRDTGRAAFMGKVPMPMLQGSCVGGGTFINSAIIWRLPEKVLARWHADYGLAEGMPQAALDAAASDLETELHVTEVQPHAVSKSDELMKAAANRMKIESRRTRRNETGCQGSARCLMGCPNGAKQSTAVNSLSHAAEHGARIFARAGVSKILFEGERAVGVKGKLSGKGRFAHQPFSIRANKAVIVSASAVQSPALLWKSGVRHAHLGEHFMAHPGTSVMGVYKDRVDQWVGASQGYEAFGLRDTLGVKFETINVPPEIVASRLPGAGQKLAGWLEKLPHIAIWAAALRADAQGSVRPSALFGEKITYDLLSNDLVRLRSGLRVLAEMHFQAGATEVLPGIGGLPEVLRSPDELKLIENASLDPINYSMLATHLFGGCRMAKDPSLGVLDANLAVNGRRNLYVMDASVFPTNTGVNPQHSIMSIATVAARRLAGG